MRRKLSWESITVQQFLDCYRLSLNTDLDETAKLQRIICILFDMTEQQVDDMTMGEFLRLSNDVRFVISSDVPGKPSRTIKVGKRRYAMVYDPTKLRHRQYVEVATFAEKPIDNMHLILASLVEPITWYGRRKKNDARDHEQIASDMLNAPIIHVYHSSVFFCNLFAALILNTRDSLVQRMMSQGTERAKAEEVITVSLNAMAGFIQPNNWQTLKT